MQATRTDIALELGWLNLQLEAELDLARRAYLEAAYQALRWVYNPAGFAAPSQMTSRDLVAFQTDERER